MKNIENKNFENEKELAQDFDNQLKGLKAEVENKDKNKNKLKEAKNVEQLDQPDFKGELDALKNLVGKNIEKMLESGEKTGDKGYVNKSNSNLKYKLDENREDIVNKNIDVAATSVDKYINSAPGFLGNRMRKIMGTEK